jgi:hypothetical protein
VPPPSGGASEQLQVYVRQLAPCHPVSQPPPTGGSAGGQAPGGPPPSSARPRVSIQRLRPPTLRLAFSAPGETTVRIEKLIGRGGERHWKRVRSLLVSAEEAGTVKADLSELPPGRYRLSVRLHQPGAETLRRVFTVPAR